MLVTLETMRGLQRCCLHHCQLSLDCYIPMLSSLSFDSGLSGFQFWEADVDITSRTPFMQVQTSKFPVPPMQKLLLSECFDASTTQWCADAEAQAHQSMRDFEGTCLGNVTFDPKTATAIAIEAFLEEHNRSSARSLHFHRGVVHRQRTSAVLQRCLPSWQGDPQ